MALAIVFVLAGVRPAPSAHAATFTPTTPAELIAAINTANSNGQDDIIDLGGQTFTLTTSADSIRGLPIIESDGGHTLTIRNGIVERSSAVGTPQFRLIKTSSSAGVFIENVTLRGGSAFVGGPFRGGAIENVSLLTVTNSTITGNSAFSDGGGIDNSGTLTVNNSTITANSAGGDGGGISNTSGTVTITNSTVSGNTASDDGGGINNSSPNATVTISGSTISGNGADGDGGGIANSGTLTITNSTVSNNTAIGLGGGIDHISGLRPLTLTHSTLSGNAASFGGGIRTFSGTPTLRATILRAGASGANCAGTFNSLGSNLSDDASCSLGQPGDQNSASLNLGPLQDNGGPTQTHALLTGSAALDAVQGSCTTDGTGGGTAIGFDQRGVVRPRGARCDAGAFESATVAAGTLQFSAATFSVGEAGPTASIVVTRTGGSDFAVGATVSLVNNLATAPADYDSTAVIVSFAPGDTASKTVSIPIVDDALDEADETVSLSLGSPTGGAAIGAQSTATLTIVDNDPAPGLSVSDPTITEPDAGTAALTFTVSLGSASGQTVAVQYATADGTAIGGAACTSGVDYQPSSGTLTFNAGETSKPVTVTVCGDTVVEGNETVLLTLTNPSNATITDGQGQGTISEDDLGGVITFSAATATVNENAGSLTLTVQRGAVQQAGAGVGAPGTRRTGGNLGTAALGAVTVQYATTDGTAQAGRDYTAVTGTLTFGVGETSTSITVPIRDDADTEPSETFTVTLSNPTGSATIGTPSTVTVTILDTSVPALPPQGQDDTDPSRKGTNAKDGKDTTLTEEQQRQREHTNRGNRDDVATEGNVVEVHQNETPPYIVLANRDGAVRVNLLCGGQCPTIRVGDYVEIDGEKQHEGLYDAEQVTVVR